MEHPMTEKVLALFAMADGDPEYAMLKKKYQELKTEFDCIAQKLTEEESDAVWALLSASVEMNWRMLELICEKYDRCLSV